MKRVISLLLATVIAFSALTVFSSANQQVVYSKASDTAYLAVKEETDTTAPIKLVKATLTADGVTQDIYLIGLVGTHTHKNQVNVVGNYFLAVFCRNNSYTDLVRDIIFENVEEGASIVLVGHSLGGMVAQQIAADEAIKDSYNVVATLTAGSPYMLCDSQTEGLLNRMADKSDIIPKIGLATIVDSTKQFSEVLTHDGGYGLDFSGAHNNSYIDPEEFGMYDAIGVEGGSAVIAYDKADMQFFGEVK